MRMRSLVVAAVLVAGCKKEKPATPPAPSPKAPVNTTEQDALWKLAPDGAIVGVVASSRAISSVESGWLTIKKLMATVPEFAPALAELEGELTKVFGSPNVTLADAGLAPGKGAASFVLADGNAIAILPVVDRDKFLKVVKGTKGNDVDTIEKSTCKTVQNVYACADSPELFDRLGKGSLKDKLALAGARGEIEVVAAIPPGKGPGSGPMEISAVVQIDRGAAIVRGAVQGLPRQVTSKLKASGKQLIDASKVAAFAVANIAPLLEGVPIPPEPIAAGVTLLDITSNVNGPVTMSILPGTMVYDVHLPLKDVAPAQKIIAQCESIPALAMLGAKLTNGVCHVNVPQMGIELDGWVEGSELRIGKKGQTATTSLTPAPIATELAQGEWAFAMYGRGTLAGEGQFPPVPLAAMPDEARIFMRAGMLLNEIGFGARADGDTVRFLLGVRTAWSNPDDVVAKLVAITPETVLQGKASATAKQIAASSPSSPFASDFKAGFGGLMVPTAVIGILAAVAIPAFMDYNKKSRKTEASLMLNRLAKNLKVAYITDGKFPKGKVPLTPAKSCCETGGKCIDATAWENPVWRAVDFQLDDMHMFRYSYESDGKAFTATAVGDLDCDGVEITYVLSGSVDAQGNPSVEIKEPPPNSD